MSDSSGKTNVVVHDFSGHPFQVQLARHLADAGYDCTHVFCDSFQTPKGEVGGADEESGFRSIALTTRKPFAKYSTRRRFVHELEYGWKAARTIRAAKPDVVISANVPLVAAAVFQLAMLLSRVPIIFWQQDVYSVAMESYLQRSAGRFGALAGKTLVQLERWLLRTSKHVVVISADFIATMHEWKIGLEKVTVIENWAPLEELQAGSRPNPWAERHGIDDDDVVFLYAGTLGLKHQPSALFAVAKEFADRDDVKVIVASEGLGAEWLGDAAAAEEHGDGLITLLPFQPYEELPDMLASADVLMVLLESDAGTFSVPSKVLTYFCAGRAILGAMPEVNLASRTITTNGVGVVVPNDDDASFVQAARDLVADKAGRQEKGRNGRAYAERTFDIDVITRRFSDLIEGVIGSRRSS
ncbi:MAG: glycosyltransferase family 4 protein [Ilumatobacter sp.]